MTEDAKKVTFRQKNLTKCPVCDYEFHKEELLSGGGRLIAGKLTDELRRLYEVSKKFGKINPLSYIITVCPNCLYSSYPKDFEALKPEEVEKLRELTSARKNAIKKFFGELDFRQDRNDEMGAATYLLVVDCYSFRNKNTAPTIKNAISSIRAAWMFNDLAEKYPAKPYKKISTFFYKKAYQYYVLVLDYIQTGKEPVEAVGHLGPDSDRNWGYEGVLYMTAILTVKIGSKEQDVKKRIENFDKCKRYLSRLFGAGKTSKSRPSELLDMTRDLYDIINQKIDEWQKELEGIGSDESPA